jgi:hypothetical protein
MCGRVAQLVEQRPFKAWVAGSNPAALTTRLTSAISDICAFLFAGSELEASSHFAALLACLRAGEEIVIKDDSRPLAVVHPPSRYAGPSLNR